jgi:O-antigen biosynthesis protein WbqV
VVPRLQEQILAGGPVTVTHPDIVRFFMTIPEAVRLVLNASAEHSRDETQRGKIMVLDMGEPVRIVDLAERMMQLAGLKPYVDIDIVFSGLRPGEKLFEELFDPSEVQDMRTEDGYVIASPRVTDKALLDKSIAELQAAVAREDRARALELLRHIVPEYRSAMAAESKAEDIARDLDNTAPYS